MTELPTSHPFEWVQYPWGPALQCRALAGVADHCFTTRQPDLPAGDGTPGDGWDDVGATFGLSRSALVRLHQVHGTRIVVIRNCDGLAVSDSSGNRRTAHISAGDCVSAGTANVGAVDPGGVAGEWGEADGSVSNDPRVALAVKTADCVPLLIGRRRTGVVAAVHAGWRGAAAGIIPAAIGELKSAFETRPADLVAAIGPSIGPCCYRVGAELRDAFVSAGQPARDVDTWLTAEPTATAAHGVPGVVPPSPDGRAPLWLDMWRVVSDQLRQCGLAPANIHESRLCTSCHRDLFHSFRVDGPAAGRMVAVIRGLA